MDNFVVSARKYRPATFNSVVGQGAITNTLKNAIRNKHLAQAFLFCGPRGVGKTTCARILAKTINCTNLTDEIEGCNECESCVAFNNGQSLNIYELDAASNNSVDDIRNLVEQVRYAPHSGQYKIYIIDEVHMLSVSAFNAFLKTLEEPPPYAIFILATTEKHKIIPTILSRCQIFDFNRITIEDIAKHLEWIASKEHVEAEPEALHLIAQKADGALRDALSIFDQIVSFAGNVVTYKHVIENLNILDYEYYFRLTDQILAGNYPSTLLILDELIRDGFDIHHFIVGYAGHFRDLLVCKDAQTVELLEVSPKTRERYLAQSKQLSAGTLFRFLEICNRGDIEFKAAQNQRLHTELMLLKLCNVTNAFNAGEVVTTTTPATEKKTIAKTVSTDKPASNITSSEVKTVTPVTKPVTESAVVEKNNQAEKEVPQSKQEPLPQATRTRTPSLGTVSISQNLKGKSVAAEENPIEKKTDDSPQLPVSENEMLQCWKEYVAKIQSEGKRQLGASLNKHLPQLIEGRIIEIAVDNNIQADEIHNHKNEMLTWMKSKLGNSTIDIRARVLESDEGKQTAYTPVEKFRQMAEKNPDLNHLREQFDLELDF